MHALYETFACKNPPDNTINRIAALEKITHGFDFDNLSKRLAEVENKVKVNHEKRITDLEDSL
jgi:hypothetical protein